MTGKPGESGRSVPTLGGEPERTWGTQHFSGGVEEHVAQENHSQATFQHLKSHSLRRAFARKTSH